MRRFRCPNPECPRGFFCERLLDFLKPHARTTDRLNTAHLWIGLALEGEPGSRLAERQAIPTSADTLLRRAERAQEKSTTLPITRDRCAVYVQAVTKGILQGPQVANR